MLSPLLMTSSTTLKCGNEDSKLKQDAAAQPSTTMRQVSKLGLFSFVGLAIVSFQVCLYLVCPLIRFILNVVLSSSIIF